MEQTLYPYQAVKHIQAIRVLVLAPHPDDEVFGCGGAILCHVEAGVQVRVILATDGGFGVDEVNREEYVLQRQNESIEAAKVLGYGAPEFWSERDRELRYGETLVLQVGDAIHNTGADLVYAPSVFEMHPDHRALGMAAVEAVRRHGSNMRLALYEVGVPLRPNLLLDISSHVKLKALAMECFTSQNERQRYDLGIAALNRYRTYTLPAGVVAAEAYIQTTAEELVNDPLKLYQSEHSRQRSLGLPMDATDVPLVSVIVRSTDRSTLSDALDSLALQTYSNVEVVLVNAKGEGHREVSPRCGPFPLRMISTGERLLRSRAANMGLDAADGQLLMFLDDDDWIMPNHVSMLVGALQKNPGKKVAYGSVMCTDEDRNPTDKIFSHAFDRTRLLVGNYIPIHSALFAQAIVKDGCRMVESLDLYEDWDFWLQASAFGDFIFVDSISAAYRIGGQSGQACHASPAVVQEALGHLLSKWCKTWTHGDLWNIMNRVVGYEEKTQECAKLQQQIDGLQLILPDFQEQLANVQQQCINLQDRNGTLQRECSDGQQKLTDFELQNTILQQRNRLQGQQLEEYRSSHSWRITAPLRIVSQWIKKIINFGK